jgi:septal ring factor EnvC (AmiA/AmiB activator)
MRRGRFRASLCGVLLLAPLAAVGQGAEDLEAEQQAVADRLLLERAALATLKDQQAGVLELIGLLERRGKLSAQRASRLEQELRAFRRQRALAERQAALARGLVERQAQALRPRLRAMYRLQRRGRLEALLTAQDFSALVWRHRALGALLEKDLRLLAELRAAAHFGANAERLLERLGATLTQRSAQLAHERSLAAQQQTILAGLLRQVGADAQLASRVVRELEQTERRLGRMVHDLESEVLDTGFSHLRGRMPWPTPGIIEVAFGKVLNPKFNTVTFRKGLDLRAPKGSPVRAVGNGQVVYAGWLKGYGNLLIVDHGGGFHTLMAHLSGFTRVVGDEVEMGELVGQVGDTGSLKGAYLYFELRKNGIAIDPRQWLGAPEEEMWGRRSIPGRELQLPD